MSVFGACFPKNDPLVSIDFTLEGEELGGVTPKNDLFIPPKVPALAISLFFNSDRSGALQNVDHRESEKSERGVRGEQRQTVFGGGGGGGNELGTKSITHVYCSS